jgi:hypothetical protein
MWYDTTISILAGGASAVFAPVDCSTLVPVAVATEIGFDSILTPTGAGNTFGLRYTGSTSAAGLVIVSGDVAGVAHESPVVVPCSALSSVDYIVTGTLTLKVSNYLDNL